jgi:hypothetical protein
LPVRGIAKNCSIFSFATAVALLSPAKATIRHDQVIGDGIN